MKSQVTLQKEIVSDTFERRKSCNLLKEGISAKSPFNLFDDSEWTTIIRSPTFM